MSELKVVKQSDVLWGPWFTEYYLKHEADKVISKLEETLNNSRNARKYWRKEYLIEYKECLHQKYKRCLAMAKLCHWKMGVFIYKEEKNEFYYRWHKRWLTLADKYKEGNV